MRFKLLNIIIFLFFLMNSFSVYSDEIYKLATNCDDLANETFGKWVVEGELKNG